ncbi:MAG: plastocyanin/azurin family copper-binding protein, partial [Nitriliruptorales bacterium]|nr:plastocyanin/azurin family copper-binding protein [Nitriliruptorales bacterium]
MRLRRSQLALGVAAGAMVLAACSPSLDAAREADALLCPTGSDCFDPPVPVGPGGSMSVRIPGFSFEVVEASLVEGPIEVTLTNEDTALHNLRIDEAAGETKKIDVDGGDTATGTLQLFAGTYTFYCDIPGHRAAGMEGTITVLEPGAEPTSAPTATDTAAPAEPDPAEGLNADNLDEGSVAALDDSADIAGALALRGFARAYDVTFASGSTELAPGASGVLDQIEAILASDDDIRLRIE